MFMVVFKALGSVFEWIFKVFSKVTSETAVLMESVCALYSFLLVLDIPKRPFKQLLTLQERNVMVDMCLM